MKSKLLGIFLLFCFAAPVATTFAFLKYQKKQIKREVKWRLIEGIDQKELVLIKLTKKEQDRELEWEHSKEFEYQGEMYDIAETKTINDTTYYWCWWDYEETELNKKLNGLVQTAFGNNPTKQEKQNKLNSFFKSLYFSATIINTKNTATDLKILFVFSNFNYQSLYSSPPVPPPEIS